MCLFLGAWLEPGSFGAGAAVPVPTCSELRGFKLAVASELGHPSFLLTLLCDGVPAAGTHNPGELHVSTYIYNMYVYVSIYLYIHTYIHIYPQKIYQVSIWGAH